MINENSEGRIITFYSFKGGVGRTMALANVAFLAAANGQRVLVIDWDLEAPGLAYYFRGLLDAPDTKALKDAPGVLDFLWDWSCSINADTGSSELDSLKKRFIEGTPFQECVRSLLARGYMPENATLDFIGAGSRSIPTPELKPYEEALAYFSWPKFFNDEAGGFVLESLRRWAKSRYDIVLVDSRTGLADVAGICTMQIPDMVAICFILNRQNIDGVAKIAAAIRTKREEAVGVRAIPMRVARRDTPEESDAKARAISELTRIGGFSSDAIQEDFRSLSVSAAENVPFYETLAPFAAQDPSLDYLTLNYLRLAIQLLGKPLEIPSFDPDLIELVRRRLQPRHATVEYIVKLKSAEPARAIAELQRLIESALETEMDGGGLEDDYVTTLVEASLGMANVSDHPFEATEMQNHTLDLLRSLATGNPEKWRVTLTSAIERYLDTASFLLDPEEELAVLEELDGLLALAPTVSARLRRIVYRRKTARLYVSQSNAEAARQTVGEILALVKEINKDGREGPILPSDQMDEVLAAEVDASIVRGDIYQQSNESDRSCKEYEAGLARLEHLDQGTARSELSRLRYELHSRLARASPSNVPDLVAAEHAAQAVKWGRGLSLGAMYFLEFAQVILRIPHRPEFALVFCENALDGHERRVQSQLANYYGRHPQGAAEFLSIIVKLFRVIIPLHSKRAYLVLKLLAESSELVLRNLLRRRRTVGERQSNQISLEISKVITVLEDAGLSLERFPNLKEARAAFKPRRSNKDISTDYK